MSLLVVMSFHGLQEPVVMSLLVVMSFHGLQEPVKTMFQGASASFMRFLTSRSDSLLKDHYMVLTFW